MMRHLKPGEVVEALEGTLGLKRLAHLDTCGTCRREVEALRAVHFDVVRNGDIPEPSPLFWTHFSERVREATTAEPVGQVAANPWPVWRALLPLGAIALVALMIGYAPRTTPSSSGEIGAAEPAVAYPLPTLDQDTWQLVSDMAAELEPEQIQEAAMPKPGSTDSLIGALTPEERRELVRLMKAEMGNE